MKKNYDISKLSDKRLNIFDKIKLYKLIDSLKDSDVSVIKTFIDDYYGVSLSDSFYNDFLYSLKLNKEKDIFSIVLNKDIYDLISYIKFDNNKPLFIEEYLNAYDYSNINTKYLNNIFKELIKLDFDDKSILLKKELENNYRWILKYPSYRDKSEYLSISIKMLLSIGLDNSLDLLNGKYGKVDYEIIHFLFKNFNVGKVHNNEVFNNYLFSNKKDPNNMMRSILNGSDIDLFLNFDYFYNSIDCFIDRFGTKLNKNKVDHILQERFIARDIENPEISGDVLDDMVSSFYHKYGIDDTEEEIINKNMEAYSNKIKTKEKSSIMKIDDQTINGFTFEMLPLTDPRNLVIGYRSGNCFRLNGDAFILFNKFLTNPNMRIISISNDEYKDFGMVLLMRNGNALIASSIELSNRVNDKINKRELYDSVKTEVETIMDKMNETDDEIVISVIGLSNENTTPYNKNVLPFLIAPALENSNQFYNGIYNYQGLLKVKEGKALNDIKLYEANQFYYDSNIIYRRDRSDLMSDYNYQQVEKIIVSLHFARFKEKPDELIEFFRYLVNKNEVSTVCTRDFYITRFDDGSYDSYINSDNPTVIEEYNKQLGMINNKVKVKTKIE